jgi:hypothetical protein
VTDGIVDVMFRRVSYEVAAVASAIRASELPDQFADALKRAASIINFCFHLNWNPRLLLPIQGFLLPYLLSQGFQF